MDTGDADDAGPNGLIKAQVLRELSAAGVSEQDLNTEGLQITTTIDPKAQAAAIEAVNSNLEGEPSELRTASVSVDPRSGAVRSYYGGADGRGFDFAQSGLQTGSSFKVFGLAAALDQASRSRRCTTALRWTSTASRSATSRVPPAERAPSPRR